MAAAHVVFVIMDGLSPRHANPSIMPSLCRLAESAGSRPSLGLASLLSLTAPALATFVSGDAPFEHGIVANPPVGGGPAWALRAGAAAGGPPRRTIFEAFRDGGRRTVAVLADVALVGVAGADRADLHWPFGGHPPDQVPRDEYGHTDDGAVLEQFLEASTELADLALVHFKGPDTAAHVHGPDSVGAFTAYRRTDDALAAIVDRYRSVWDRTIVVAVSDHGQETVLVREPIDLQPVLSQEAPGWTVQPHGSGALAVWSGVGAADGTVFTRFGGVEGDIAWSPTVRLLWAGLGRYFGPGDGDRPAGVHGGPRSAGQVVAVGGGHPLARAAAAAAERAAVPATAWAPALAGWIGLAPAGGRGDVHELVGTPGGADPGAPPGGGDRASPAGLASLAVGGVG